MAARSRMRFTPVRSSLTDQDLWIFHQHADAAQLVLLKGRTIPTRGKETTPKLSGFLHNSQESTHQRDPCFSLTLGSHHFSLDLGGSF